MKNIIYLFSLLILASCSNYKSKSIFEDLDKAELNEAIKNPDFVKAYEFIKEIRESEEVDDLFEARFRAITYGKMVSFVTLMADTVKTNKIQARWRQNWEKQYAIYRDTSQMIKVLEMMESDVKSGDLKEDELPWKIQAYLSETSPDSKEFYLDLLLEHHHGSAFVSEANYIKERMKEHIRARSPEVMEMLDELDNSNLSN